MKLINAITMNGTLLLNRAIALCLTFPAAFRLDPSVFHLHLRLNLHSYV